MPQPLPNLHHLELFYHVTRSGGITAATRSMPYGIQQPAVSGQITLLEQELGARLFQRRPFKLTPAGVELYEFIAPFFDRLPDVANKIAGKAERRLRLAAPTMVISEHLPQVIAAVKRKQPLLELTLIEAGQRRAIDALQREEVDLAIAEMEGKAPAGTAGEVLINLPLVLLAPTSLAGKRPELKDLVGKHSLVRLPVDTAISRLFARGMQRKKLAWPAAIEVSTIELVHAYAAQGFGVGLSVCVPGVKFPKGVEVVDLAGFSPLVIMALWRGTLTPLAKQVLGGLRRIAGG